MQALDHRVKNENDTHFVPIGRQPDDELRYLIQIYFELYSQKDGIPRLSTLNSQTDQKLNTRRIIIIEHEKRSELN